MLDIIRKQVGDRKSGLVFNNMNAAEKKVNAALKNRDLDLKEQKKSKTEIVN